MHSLTKVSDRIRGNDSPADEAKSAAKDARGKIDDLFGGAKKTARRSYIRGRVAAAKATAPRRTKPSAKSVAAAGTAGAAGAYFFDPIAGKRRREQAVEKAKGLFNRNGHEKVEREPVVAGTTPDRPNVDAS